MLLVLEIWKSRNLCTFEYIHSICHVICILVLRALRDHTTLQLSDKVRFISPPALTKDIPTGFFNGVTKERLCGVGIVLNIKNDNHIRLKMEVGRVINNREYLLACWGLMWFSKKQGILWIKNLEDLKCPLIREKGFTRFECWSWSIGLQEFI